jgi:ABC-2 type transport system ATP-binding protein
MTYVIRVADVSKQFTLHHSKSLKERLVQLGRDDSVERFWALRDITLDVEESSTLGLIGPNGSGKSTLLKLMGGILAPTTGYVEHFGRVAALLELGAGFHPDLTGRENIYLNASILGLTKRQIEESFDAIVDFSGIERFIDNQVKYYSSGMYVRLAFAVAVHVEPEILLVDEVLAVGDEPFQRKCIARIKAFQREGRTIVVVSHGMDLVRELSDRMIFLEQGHVIVDGEPAAAVREYRERYAPVVTETGVVEQGTREIEIIDGVVADASGTPTSTFAAGDELVLEVAVRSDAGVEDPAVGFEIYNHLELLLCGASTASRGVDLGTVRGVRRIRFSCRDIPFIEGTYFVSFIVSSRHGESTYHRRDKAASFRVRADQTGTGVMHLEPVVELAADEAA